MKPITFIVLFVASSCLGASQVSLCGYGDVCEAIVFNQLALAAIKEEMKGLMLAFNNTKLTGDHVQKQELSTCESEKQGLQAQIESLENKLKEKMAQDEAEGAEKEDLQANIDKLNGLNEQLKNDADRLEGEIAKYKESIDKLLKNARPIDCADIQFQGKSDSGVYSIYHDRSPLSTEVYCDLETEGGGWTVFLTRKIQLEPLDFNESWENFKKGFGSPDAEHWLGNDVIHALTSSSPSTLRVEAESFSGDKRWAEWNLFSVANEVNKYQVKFDNYNNESTLGDSLSANSDSFFTTFDIDNDHQDDLNCAVGSPHSMWGKGGWWYFACGAARPTAPLQNTDYWNSACWQMFDRVGSQATSLRRISMKFRRHNYESISGVAN